MYSFESRVRYSECDQRTQITIPALINYLQDASMFHTDSLGRTLEYYAEHGFAWFIAAWQIEIDRFPRFGDHITVSTWCNSMKPTSALRDYTITGEDGAVWVRAETINVVFDSSKGRATRIPDDEQQIYLSDDERVSLPPTTRKLKVAGEGQQESPITVSLHHLDTNHHVNNVQYVVMASDVVRGHDEFFTPRRILVQYQTAAKLDDVIVPRVFEEDGGYAVDLADAEGNTFAIVRMER